MPVPSKLYAEVADNLRQRIESQELSDVLPSEAKLQAEFGVSRSVVRQALNVLTREGLIVKSQGRPTRVRTPSHKRRVVQSLNGLGMQAERLGHSVETKALSLERVHDTRFESDWETSEAYRLLRLRIVDGDPIAHIETVIPAPVFGSLTLEDFVDSSLHSLISGSSQLTLHHSRRSVRAVRANDEMAVLLEVPSGEALLVLEGATFDTDNRVVEFFSTHHRSDRVSFDLETTVAP